MTDNKPTQEEVEQAKEWNRIAATPGMITNPSQRLPILGRYRAGETVAALANDYAIPSEQVEWGIRIGFLLEAHDELTAKLADTRALLSVAITPTEQETADRKTILRLCAERDSLKRQLEAANVIPYEDQIMELEIALDHANAQLEPLGCGEGHLRVHWVEATTERHYEGPYMPTSEVLVPGYCKLCRREQEREGGKRE